MKRPAAACVSAPGKVIKILPNKVSFTKENGDHNRSKNAFQSLWYDRAARALAKTDATDADKTATLSWYHTTAGSLWDKNRPCASKKK